MRVCDVPKFISDICAMHNQRLDNVLFWALLAVFAAAYLLTFPSGWLISDEYTYTNQAMAICGGEKVPGYVDAITGDFVNYASSGYSFGNAFWISIWMTIFGVSYSYVGSLMAVLIGMVLLYRVLRMEGYLTLAICLAFVYPAVVFFSHTQMSGVPSFLLVCWFLYGLFGYEDSGRKWLLLCALASFSFWVRETNIVLLGGICLVHFMVDRRWFRYYAVGAFIGMIPRLLSHWYYYDDPFYYVLGEAFRIEHLVQNIGVYTVMGLIMMPLGWLALSLYAGRYRWPIVVSSWIFVLVYLFYGYNAIEYSGLKTGVMVMSRFYLPLVPIYVIVVGSILMKWKLPRFVEIGAYAGTAVVIVGLHYLTHRESAVHAQASSEIYERYGDSFAFYDMSKKTNIIRYLNPYHGHFAGHADLSKFQEEEYMTKVMSAYGEAYLILSENKVNQAKRDKTSELEGKLDLPADKYISTEEDHIYVKPGLTIRISKIRRR